MSTQDFSTGSYTGDVQAYWVRDFSAGSFQLSPYGASNGGGGGGGGFTQNGMNAGNLNSSSLAEGWSTQARLLAIILGRPNSKLVKDEILPNLTYWHHRSASFLDILYVGLAEDNHWAHWDEKAFCSFLKAFRSKTSYRYSGETDLILCNSYGRKQSVLYNKEWLKDLIVFLYRL